MNVSPAKHNVCHSTKKCVTTKKSMTSKKCDYRRDKQYQRDRKRPDKVIPMCCYALQATQKSIIRLMDLISNEMKKIQKCFYDLLGVTTNGQHLKLHVHSPITPLLFHTAVTHLAYFSHKIWTLSLSHAIQTTYTLISCTRNIYLHVHHYYTQPLNKNHNSRHASLSNSGIKHSCFHTTFVQFVSTTVMMILASTTSCLI